MDDWLTIGTLILPMALTYRANTRVVECSKNCLCGSANGPATAEIKNMNKQWKASRYRYPDGRPRNEDRYKIFVWENGKWVSVGGAIRKWGDKTVAYLCMPAAQRDIRTPRDAERKTEGPLAQVGAGGQHFKTI